MKQKKLKKLLLKGITVGICLSPWTMIYAAQQEMLWGPVNEYLPILKNFSLTQTTAIPKGLKLPADFSTRGTVNTFQFTNGHLDDAHKSHVRYDQMYQGLPVWGTEVVYHVSSKNNTSITGAVLNGIEKDVPNLNGKLSIDQIKQIAIGKNNVAAKVNMEKIIFFDPEISSKATLAYHASYLSRTADGPSMPNYIIDANTGKILQEWNGLTTTADGQGLGGVQVNKEYQYGSFRPGMNALGMFEVTHASASICSLSSNLFRIYNLKNLQESQLGFTLPVPTYAENTLAPFAYYCTSPNLNDNGYAPTNGGISPINDVNYFVNQTLTMLTTKFGVTSPIGTQLPLRVYTHIANYDNAFACDPGCMLGMGIVGPQQLVFGNGAMMFAPLTEGDVVAHEFGHLVTANFSKLFYTNQSGGMNEAFSDMTGMEINHYMRNEQRKTWYWNGTDWNTGSSISKSGSPTRYFDEPTKDGVSISNAANFRIGMNTHYSSGVYNKMFYLLSNTTGWTMDKAYRIMLDANMNYWTAGATYISGACGVLQAAANRGYSVQDVRNAFQGVGVVTTPCIVLKS